MAARYARVLHGEAGAIAAAEDQRRIVGVQRDALVETLEVDAAHRARPRDQVVEAEQRGERGLRGAGEIDPPHPHRLGLALDGDAIEAVTRQAQPVGELGEHRLADERLTGLGAIAEARGNVDRVTVAVAVVLDDRPERDAGLDPDRCPPQLGAGQFLEHVLKAGGRLHRGDRIVEQHQHAIAEILDDAPAGTGEVAAEGVRAPRDDLRRRHVACRLEQACTACQIGEDHGPDRLLH